MVRHRWTLALILISVPILATVITAFRVRDLPRSSPDGLKPVSKKQYKCENCDVSELNLDHSLKIESVKHLYDDKSVIDKQPLVKNKVLKVDDDDDDEDDDDDNGVSNLRSKLLNVGGVNIQDRSKRKDEKSKKLVEQNKKIVRDDHETDDDDDDDDDVDDDDDNDVKGKGTVNQKIKQVQKTTRDKNLLGKSTSIKMENSKSVRHDDGDDGDDDDDDDDDDDEDDDDDDDDDDDSDDEDNDGGDKVRLTKSDQVSAVKMTDVNKKVGLFTKSKSATVKLKEIKKIPDTDDDGNDDDDDDDDEDDDEDDDDDDDDDDGDDDDNDDKKVKSIKGKSIDVKKEKNKISETKIKITDKKTVTKSSSSKPEANDKVKKGKHTGDDDNDKDDDDDDDDGDDDDDDDDDVDDDDDDDDDGNIPTKTSKKLTNSKLNSQIIAIQQKQQVKDAKDTKKSIKNKDNVDDKKETIEKSKLKPQEKHELKVSVVVQKELDSFFEDEIKKKEVPKKMKQEKGVVKKDEKKGTTKETVKDDKQKVPKKVIKFDKEKNKLLEKERKKDGKDIDDGVQQKLTKADSYIKQVSEVLHRKNLLQSEFEDFYAFFPTFAPNFSRIANPECRRHGQILLRQLRGTKLWAINILDATAKIPSGILQGNGIQLGDFDQCLGSRARVQLDTGSVVKIQGKYCLARFEVKAEHPELEAPVHLAQAKNLFNSRIDDPGHFVPRFSTLSWGVCVPAPCHADDVETIIKDAIKHYQHRIGLAVRVKVDDIDCHMRQSGKWWEKWTEVPTLVTLAFYGVIILIIIIATVLDYLSKGNSGSEEAEEEKGENDEPKTASDDEQEENVGSEKKSDGILSSFSLYRTIRKLIGPTRSEEITCIHGVRAISTIALVIGHKFLPTGVTPYTNRLDITETVSHPIWSWTRAGWIFTDSFLLLSGALKAHRVSLIDIIISRYIKLAPALLAVTLFYAYVWDNLSEGPLWGTLVTKNAEICQESWWWNMLFIQNYFNMEEMCAPQTHQLALDMQLSVFGWLILLLTKSESILSRTLVPSVHLVSAYLRYSTVRDHRLSMIAYHGMTVSQIYRTARLSYMSVFHRCSPYLIGLSLGHALRHPGRHGKFFLTLGWLVSTALWVLVLWAGYDSGSTEYRYDISFAAKYAALAPVASAIALAWLIYVVQAGYCGFLSRILSCRIFVIISRLSYAIYLIQFVVFFTNAATIKTSSEFTLLAMIDPREISTIILSSVILTLTFIIPMQSLYRESPTETKGDDSENDEPKESLESNAEQNVVESDNKGENVEDEEAPSRRQSFLAHREHLEEIPEVEVEYESQRDSNEGLEEILEEEEDDSLHDNLEDDLEIIEEEQEQDEGGEEDYWADRREYLHRRSYSRNSDRDLDEWEWTANGQGRNGAQHYRNSR